MVLPRLEEPVVHRQIHIHDHHVGHRLGALTSAENLGHRLDIGHPAGVEQEPQRLVNLAFSFLSGQVEDRQVILDHAAGPPVFQQVVGHPKPAGGEHRIAVAVLLERPGLADQPVDHVAIIDPMLASPSEPGQGVDLAGSAPDIKGFGPDMNIDLLTNQSAGQRIGVAANMDRAARIDSRLEPSGHLQPASRQRR
jgi:hypothetical protein